MPDGKRKLTVAEWDEMAGLLARAAIEHPKLIGFHICEVSARGLAALLRLELARREVVLELDRQGGAA